MKGTTPRQLFETILEAFTKRHIPEPKTGFATLAAHTDTGATCNDTVVPTDDPEDTARFYHSASGSELVAHFGPELRLVKIENESEDRCDARFETRRKYLLRDLFVTITRRPDSRVPDCWLISSIRDGKTRFD